jgi:1,2-diacylglycerol 3-beta-galactosyltransferase
VTKVDFVYFDAGGGHRSAALALKSVIESQDRQWEVRLVNLQDVLDPLDVFRKVTRIRLADLYNRMIAGGWTLGSAQALKGLHGLIKLYHRPMVRVVSDHWRATGPDLVVSVIPNFNRVLHDALRAARPRVPFVTVLTDMADYPPHFWIERQEQDLICGTARAVDQALSLGYSPSRIFRTSGMVLRPSFYEPLALDRESERKRLGLDPTKPVGLVLFGGEGSRAMLRVARRLGDLQLVMLCGRNDGIAAALRQEVAKAPRVIEGFTDRVPHYMAISDFLVGKAGPGSVSEAVAMGLPVIIEKNAWTLPQERYNAEWVRENGVGVVLRSFRQVRRGVDQILASLDRFRTNAARLENRAVFEIPEILETMLARGARARA